MHSTTEYPFDYFFEKTTAEATSDDSTSEDSDPTTSANQPGSDSCTAQPTSLD